MLVLLLPVLALASVGNEQMFNAYLLWGERSYRPGNLWLDDAGNLADLDRFGDRHRGDERVAGLLALVGDATAREPDEITKLTLGAMICALAPLVLVAAALTAAGRARSASAWALPFHTINEIGFANLYPVGMALFSRCAPRGWGSTMIAIFFLHIFASNLLVGWLGAQLGTMTGPAFWGLHAGLIGAAALVLVLVRQVAGRVLVPTEPGIGAPGTLAPRPV